MPFANEHTCRVRNPGDFQQGSFRRLQRRSGAKSLSIIVGRLKGQSSTTTQAFRYPKDSWTSAEARSHCDSHDGKLFEPASGSDSVAHQNHRFALDSEAGLVLCCGIVPAHLDLTCSLDVQAALGDELAKFSMIANTGNPMRVSGFPAPVILAIGEQFVVKKTTDSEIKMQAKGFSSLQRIPALKDHEIEVGHTTSVKIDGIKILAEGVFSVPGESTDRIIQGAKNRFPWQASVGADIGKADFLDSGESAQINGRTVQGPMILALETTGRELTITKLGADSRTSVKVS